MFCVYTNRNKLYYFIGGMVSGIYVCCGMYSKLDCIFPFCSADSEITPRVLLSVNNSRILFNGCGWCQCRKQMINSNNSWFRFNCLFWRLLRSLLIAVIGVPIDSNDSVFNTKESEVSNVICRELINQVEPSTHWQVQIITTSLLWQLITSHNDP